MQQEHIKQVKQYVQTAEMDITVQEEKQEQLVQVEHKEMELQLPQLKQLHVKHVQQEDGVLEELIELLVVQ